ncbi:MAG TPA: GTPase Era [Thermoanaerobaculia bacterium]|nr:GTPase Era [Thermoanaerobaculia bacterium]
MKVGEVAVVGRPNAGKSTLVNALVGEKVAIVSDKPQTTRSRVLGVARRPEAEIALVDTPGIHRPKFRMNAAMVRDATDALASADAILFVVDALEERGPGDAAIGELALKAGAPVVLAVNKIDRLKKDALLPLLAALSQRAPYGSMPDLVPVSAKTGENVDRLFGVLADRLPEGDAAYPDDFLTATPETEWIGEVIREKLLERTRDEIPFAHAVVVESVEPGAGKDITVVKATIVVEREGQKGIVVGKGGAMVRAIGTAAREELERELGRRLFLELTVRVQPDWRNDERFLSRLRREGD